MLSAIGCTTTSSNMTPQIRPGSLFVYDDKFLIRICLSIVGDRCNYMLCDLNSKVIIMYNKHLSFLPSLTIL